MAPDTFAPLRAEELTDVRVPQRLLNYGGLVDAIAHRMVKDRIAVTKGLKAVGFGRWMLVHGNFYVHLKVSPTAWHEHGATPLWCEYKCSEDVAQNLRAQLDGATLDGSGKAVVVRIPVRLKAGVERDGVIDDAVTQMRSIADALLETCPAPD
ncbi:MAG: hypothetical protein OXH04_21700 [Acidobacteria bacterium]|nr:hypothetical protein [Acidobacteriota bacterium]